MNKMKSTCVNNDRRSFLRRSSLVALTPSVPSFLCQHIRAEENPDDGRVLVVLQLSGGNDGINTVIGHEDEGYARHRDVLRLKRRDLVPVSQAVGLHPSMRGVADLMEDGRLSIVQGVGYPNPSRSHDVSMSTWQTARLDPQDHQASGWLGRALDQVKRPHDGSSHAMLVGDDAPPIAIRGRKAIWTSMANLDEMKLDEQARITPKNPTGDSGDDLLSFVTRTAVDAHTTADLIGSVAGHAEDAPGYPDSTLAQRLRTIAGLIKADLGTQVYYAIQPGYDTHSDQLRTHSRLLSDLSRSLKSFMDDLRESELDDRVLVMCFSEFGRRVKENGSNGTDHGTAGPVILAGGKVKPGLIGRTPSLTDLAGGDLKVQVDFRSVYASLLDDWLGLSSKSALGNEIQKLSVVS